MLLPTGFCQCTPVSLFKWYNVLRLPCRGDASWKRGGAPEAQRTWMTIASWYGS